MAYEDKWTQYSANFTANGQATGVITVASTVGLHTKQEVIVAATGQPSLPLEVKEILSGTTARVGTRASLSPNGSGAGFTGVDLSAYTVAASGNIFAGVQEKKDGGSNSVIKNVYEEDPVVALRVIQVDNLGNIVNGGVNTQVVNMGATVSTAGYNSLNATAGSASTFITGTAVGTLQPQVSNDGINWSDMPGVSAVSVSGPGNFGVSWTGNGWAYVRATFKYTSGTGSNPVYVVLKTV